MPEVLCDHLKAFGLQAIHLNSYDIHNYYNAHYCPIAYKIGYNENLDFPGSRINTGFPELA